MAFTWDPIYVVNLILCIIILAIGFLGYMWKKDKTPLLIGIAFGFFGFSHLTFLLGLKAALTDVLIVIRTTAYLIVVFTLYLIAFRHKK